MRSNNENGEKNNTLKYFVTGKNPRYFEIQKKKRFPMYVDHIQFLKQRAGWKVTNVHNFYTFKQKNFKKEFVLGNQRARQEAVAKNDNVQGNFYKLMNNSNFSYDCRDHSQNRNI